MRQTTLCFLITKNQILLATKKTGMGIGNLNGCGGKVEAHKTIESAAARETEEEVGVRVRVEDLEKVATIRFYFPEKTDWNQEMHVFFARRWDGVPVETPEMRPEWVSLEQIPYNRMWADDIYWLPRVLAGEKIEAEFYFKENNKDIEKYEVRQI
jgi:8-oxo-dGTP pyrophosphatase MutT (NUDIX family)